MKKWLEWSSIKAKSLEVVHFEEENFKDKTNKMQRKAEYKFVCANFPEKLQQNIKFFGSYNFGQERKHQPES